jgi:putative hydrolase of the HAD superfamily
MLRFRGIDQDLQLKVNVRSVADVIDASERYHANIVEVGLDNMSEELVDACRQLGLKIMINHMEKEPQAFREILRWDVDMVNVNHGDLFSRVAGESTIPRVLAICIDFGDTLIDEQTEVKDDTSTTLRADLIPGAGELVRELSRRGYKLALVADGRPGTYYNVLTQHGLYDLFDVFAISDQIGVSKPNPRMFLCALDQLGIAREDYGRTVMMGNNLECDIKGANGLGMVSVWLDWAPRRSKVPGDESQVPQYTIKMPLDLLQVIETLEHGYGATDES